MTERRGVDARWWRATGLAAAAALLLQGRPAAAADPADPKPVTAKSTVADKGGAPPPAEPLISANAPPFSEGIFPCSGCHDPKDPPNTRRRELSFHDEQQSVLSHGEGRWCLDCHDARNRDELHLTSGELVPFTESYRLCGQCHGAKYRDWKVGVHGKRVGQWNGAKTYFLCVNCHNPHTPRFKGVKEVVVDGRTVVTPTLTLIHPMPRPRRPEENHP